MISRGLWFVLCSVLSFSVPAISIQAQQHVAPPDNEPRPIHPPKVTPEPRRKAGIDPDLLFTKIASKNAVEAESALKRIGLSWLAGRRPTEVRLLAVNLDDDDDPERILVVRDDLMAQHSC